MGRKMRGLRGRSLFTKRGGALNYVGGSFSSRRLNTTSCSVMYHVCLVMLSMAADGVHRLQTEPGESMARGLEPNIHTMRLIAVYLQHFAN